MKRYARNYELKDSAKRMLTGNYGVMVGGLLMFLFASMLVFIFLDTIATAILSLSPVSGSLTYSVNILQSLAQSFFSAFITMGFALMCLKIYTKRQIAVSDIFCGFRQEYFGKYAAVAIFRAVISYLFSIPSSLYARQYLTGTFGIYNISVFFGIMILEYIIMVPLLLPLDLSCFLILDFDSKSPIEIIFDSYHICRGQMLRFFGLQFSFLPIYLLGALSLGIGFLWIVPYIEMTMTMFYIDLMNPQDDTEPEPEPIDEWFNQ